MAQELKFNQHFRPTPNVEKAQSLRRLNNSNGCSDLYLRCLLIFWTSVAPCYKEERQGPLETTYCLHIVR